MATMEDTLAASTSVGTRLFVARSYHGMTLRPAIDFPSVALAAAAKTWLESVWRDTEEKDPKERRAQRFQTAMADRTLFVQCNGHGHYVEGIERALEIMGNYL